MQKTPFRSAYASMADAMESERRYVTVHDDPGMNRKERRKQLKVVRAYNRRVHGGGQKR